MREVNKDLKGHFRELQGKVTQLMDSQVVGDKENNRQLGGDELRRQEMLDEIQAMIGEYKKKQTYDNMLTNMNHPTLPSDDSGTEDQPVRKAAPQRSALKRAREMMGNGLTKSPYEGAVHTQESD